MNAKENSLGACSFPAEVTALTKLSPNVVRLALRPTSQSRGEYEAGQYLSIALPDGDARSYSYASPQRDDGQFDLHIRLYRDGKFSKLLMDGLPVGHTMSVTGPFGDCVFQQPLNDAEPVLMLATGTGIAPIKAMLETSLHEGCANPIWLYWGGETLEDLYLFDFFQQLASDHPQFRFVPVLNSPADSWTGERGFVQNAVTRHHPDMASAHVYACGAPIMVDSARKLLTERFGLRAERFLSDSFELSAPPLAGDTIERGSIPLLITPQGGTAASTPIPLGETLMSGLRREGLITAVCGGKQSCGTCRVRLSAGDFNRLPLPQRTEQRLLQALPGAGPFDRLSCQITVQPELAGIRIVVPREQ